MKDNSQNQKTKTFLGMPMRWEHRKIFKGLWNAEDDRIFPPKYFGIGWTINFHALLKKFHIIRSNKTDEYKK